MSTLSNFGDILSLTFSYPATSRPRQDVSITIATQDADFPLIAVSDGFETLTGRSSLFSEIHAVFRSSDRFYPMGTVTRSCIFARVAFEFDLAVCS